MDTTALYCDVVLPAASYYEKTDLNSTDCHSYIHPFGKVLDPLFESKHRLGHLPRPGEEDGASWRAERGLAPYRRSAARLGPRLHQDSTTTGAATASSASRRGRRATSSSSHSPETKGMTYRGPARSTRSASSQIDAEAWNSEIEDGRGLHAVHSTRSRRSGPGARSPGGSSSTSTTTGSCDLGEQLPVLQGAAARGRREVSRSSGTRRTAAGRSTPPGATPLPCCGCSAGCPIVYIHPDDAKTRGIQDNDWVKVFNDRRQRSSARCRSCPARSAGG